MDEVEKAIDVLLKDCMDNNSLGFKKVIKKLVDETPTIFEVEFNINQFELDTNTNEFINILEKNE